MAKNSYLGLAPLDSYGGPTKTHLVLNDSPAVDAGSDAVAEAYDLLTDQRGFTRFYDVVGVRDAGGNLTDIGAYEDPEPIVVTSFEDYGQSNELTLREVLNTARERGDDENLIVFDPVEFSQPRTIVLRDHNGDLAPDELVIDFDVTIEGPGSDLLTVSGSGRTRVFRTSEGSDVEIINLTVANGYTLPGYLPNTHGGGIYTAGDLLLKGVHLLNNTSGYDGGAIAGQGLITLEIIDSVIEGNTATADGGGISLLGDGGDLRMRNTTVVDNHSTNGGGGINVRDAEAIIESSTIIGNSSQYLAGGVYVVDDNLTITNSTISDNTGQDGGGITAWAWSWSPQIEITNSTIVGNRTTNGYKSGAGISTLGNSPSTVFVLRNNIVAQNVRLYDGKKADLQGNYSSDSTHNLIGALDATNSNWPGVDSTTLALSGTPQNPVDPLLAPLGDYGGLTKTHALLPHSPAIDAADSTAGALVAGGNDQRGDGYLRIHGEALDIGAYESNIKLLNGQLEVYGTALDDDIAINTQSVSISSIGNFLFELNSSPSTIKVYGGDGDDHIAIDEAFAQTAYIYGELGNDDLIGGIGTNWVSGGGGDDIIRHRATNSVAFLLEGPGDDMYVIVDDPTHEWNGNFSLVAIIPEGDGSPSGVDTLDLRGITGGGVNVSLAQSTLQDILGASEGVQLLVAQSSYAFEEHIGAADIENIIGSIFDDTLTGNELANIIDGGAGDDTIAGEGGDDFLYGGDGNEVSIDGGEGDDVIFGQGGDDTLVGGEGDDYVDGGEGTDQFLVDPANTGSYQGDDVVDEGAAAAVSDSTGNVNFAPILDPIEDRLIDAGQSLSFSLTASDSDSPPQTLSYSLLGETHGASLTSGGAFTWTPGSANFGDYSFTVVVQDSGTPSLLDIATFSVVVSADAPRGLRNNGGAQLSQFIRWNQLDTATSGYVIERRSNGSAWSVIGERYARNQVTFSDTNVEPGAVYEYRVAGKFPTGVGPFSSPVEIRVKTFPGPGLTVEYNAVSGFATVNWSSASADQFHIERMEADSTTGWERIATVEGDVREYEDDRSNREYKEGTYYRVLADLHGAELEYIYSSQSGHQTFAHLDEGEPLTIGGMHRRIEEGSFVLPEVATIVSNTPAGYYNQTQTTPTASEAFTNTDLFEAGLVFAGGTNGLAVELTFPEPISDRPGPDLFMVVNALPDFWVSADVNGSTTTINPIAIEFDDIELFFPYFQYPDFNTLSADDGYVLEMESDVTEGFRLIGVDLALLGIGGSPIDTIRIGNVSTTATDISTSSSTTDDSEGDGKGALGVLAVMAQVGPTSLGAAIDVSFSANIPGNKSQDAIEADELTLVPLNSNFDEQNHNSYGQLVPDFEADATHGHRIYQDPQDAPDRQLVPLTVTLLSPHASQGGNWELTFPGEVRVWLEDTGNPGSFSEITSGQAIPAEVDEFQTRQLLVEGMELTDDEEEFFIRGTFQEVEDSVRISVKDLNLQADSDNNGVVDLEDDAIEVAEGEPGVWIARNSRDFDGDGIPAFADGFDTLFLPDAQKQDTIPEAELPFAEIKLRLPDGVSAQHAKVRFRGQDGTWPSDLSSETGVYSLPPGSGEVRVWIKDGQGASSFLDLGTQMGVSRKFEEFSSSSYDLPTRHMFMPGEWLDASWIGFSDDVREMTFYLEGVRNSPTAGNTVIAVDLSPSGDTNGPLLTDELKATVFEIDLDIGSIETGTVPTDVLSDQREGLFENAARIPLNDGNWDAAVYVPGGPNYDYLNNDPNLPILDWFDGYDSAGITPLQGTGNSANGGVSASRNFTPLEIELSPAIDASTAYIRLIYDQANTGTIEAGGLVRPAGSTRVWLVDGTEVRNAATVTAGGDLVASEEWVLASDLGLSNQPGGRRIRLFVEGINNSVAGDRVKVELDPTGSNMVGVASDEVQVLVGTYMIAGRIHYEYLDANSPLRFAQVNWKSGVSGSNVVATSYLNKHGEFVIHVPAALVDTLKNPTYFNDIEIALTSDPNILPETDSERTVSVIPSAPDAIASVATTIHKRLRLPITDLPTSQSGLLFLDHTGKNSLGAGAKNVYYSTAPYSVYDAGVTGVIAHELLPSVPSGHTYLSYGTIFTTQQRGNFGQVIHVNWDDADAWDTILHEYGHTVSSVGGFDSRPLALVPDHDIGYNQRGADIGLETPAQMSIAWNEGWANYYSMYAQRAAPVPFRLNIGVDGLEFDDYSIENNTRQFSHDGRGEDEELSIAKLLWDIADSENEAGDIFSDGHSSLYALVVEKQPTSFKSFWYHYTAPMDDASVLEAGRMLAELGMSVEGLEMRLDAFGTAMPAGTVVNPETSPYFVWHVPQGNQQSTGPFAEVGDLHDSFRLHFWTHRNGQLTKVHTTADFDTSSLVAIGDGIYAYQLSQSEWQVLQSQPEDTFVWSVQAAWSEILDISWSGSRFWRRLYWSAPSEIELAPEELSP